MESFLGASWGGVTRLRNSAKALRCEFQVPPGLLSSFLHLPVTHVDNRETGFRWESCYFLPVWPLDGGLTSLSINFRIYNSR